MDSLDPASPAAVAIDATSQPTPYIWKFWGTVFWGLVVFAAMFIGQITVVGWFMLRQGGTFDLVRASSAHTTAAIYYGPRNAGTSMQVQVSGIPDGTHCQLWVTTFGGQHVRVGGWTVYGAPGNWYQAASPVATSTG